MCGILVLSGTGSPFTHRQLASLRARGPDAIGFWSDNGVNVAQTRLAVVGVGDRGVGPFENERHVLSFNGEIYNFHQLRDRLRHAGVDLGGANDGEVLLHAWTHWGRAILTQLEGFWAFSVFEKESRTLTLVRDQLGVKPLYYTVGNGLVAAASMIRTLVEVLPKASDLDYEALSEYAAYQFTFGDKTFLSSIRKVLPGHIVDINIATGHVTDAVYEDIFATPDKMVNPGQDWIRSTRDLLQNCVLRSTLSDAALTTLCSGGIDSSLITRIVEPELAYHCNFSDPDCNETFFARQAVEGIGTRLFVVNASESFDLVTKLRGIVEDFDELTVGSVVLPLEDLLSQVTRRFKVVLLGTGGDELFGGYIRYQLAMGECLQDSYRGAFESMAKVKTVADRFHLTHRKGNTQHFRFFDRGVEDTFGKAFEACAVGIDDLGAMLAFDRRYFLPALLNIDDKMAGRHSLEGRPSFLHQEFVRHVNKAAPSGLVKSGQELKWALRSVASPLLPRSITERHDKMGFTTPIGDFVRASAPEIREQLWNSPFAELYDLTKVNPRGESKFGRDTFGLLMMDLWLNRYAV